MNFKDLLDNWKFMGNLQQSGIFCQLWLLNLKLILEPMKEIEKILQKN